MGLSGVRGVSSEEPWDNLEGTFIPGEKHSVCEREVQREQGERGQGYRKIGDRSRKEEGNKCLEREEG